MELCHRDNLAIKVQVIYLLSLIELWLIGAFQEITKKKNNRGKGRRSVADEIGGTVTALLEEFAGLYKIPDKIDSICALLAKRVLSKFDDSLQKNLPCRPSFKKQVGVIDRYGIYIKLTS